MGMMAKAEPIGGRLPSGEEQAAANQLRSIIAANIDSANPLKLNVTDQDGSAGEVHLTPALSQILLDLLRHFGRGDAVTLLAVGQQLTTQEAADILNVSRPHLIKLLERGDIPHQTVGRHRRVKAADLLRYKAERDQRCSEAMAEMIREDAELY